MVNLNCWEDAVPAVVPLPGQLPDPHASRRGCLGGGSSWGFKATKKRKNIENQMESMSSFR